MRVWPVVWVIVLSAAGCCAPGQPAAARPGLRSASPNPPTIELPLTSPTIPVLDAPDLPKLPPRTISGPVGTTFRRLTERNCLVLAATNVSLANLLDEENQVPPPRDQKAERDQLRQSIRYHTALELRNKAAGEALDRFFQIADVEARTDLLRKSFPIVDGLLTRAREAKAANVRFPLDLAELERQRSQLESQLEQAELGSRVMDLDLKRRLGRPYEPAGERLWPVGQFPIDPVPLDVDGAVKIALADRPELRGLRALHANLTPDTLPDIRDFLRSGSPFLGQGPLQLQLPWLLRCLLRMPSGPTAETYAEVAVRKKQLQQTIDERERAIADETRAAALSLNAQRVRAILARDRFLSWGKRLEEARSKAAAAQPGAEFLLPQVELEWLKAHGDLIAEVAVWHQLRIKLRTAQGRLVWEAVTGDGPAR
jgi:hypothetical protein